MKDAVYIIGGGTTLDGFDFNLLKHKDTIVINHAVKYVSNPTYFLTADSGVIKQAIISDFWGLNKCTKKIAVIGSDHKKYNAIKEFLPKFDHTIVPSKYNGEISKTFEDFATGKNSGFCGLQFAIAMGYKRIFLLGFDLQKQKGRKYFYKDGIKVNSPYSIFIKHFKTALEIIKSEMDVEVISCSKISPLNDDISYVPLNKLFKEQPIYLSHYTKKTPYAMEVRNLEQSLKKWKLDYDIEGIESLGTWRANSNWCAWQIQKALQKYPGRDILRLDADARVQVYPNLFEDSHFEADIAAVIWNKSKMRPGGEFLGGTLFFANNKRTRFIVDKWVKELMEYPLKRPGDSLWEIINKYKDKINFQKLPLSYCCIFDLMSSEVEEPIIEHFQASRRFKSKINAGGQYV